MHDNKIYIHTLMAKYDRLIAQGMGHVSMTALEYQHVKTHIAMQAKKIDDLTAQAVELAAGIATAHSLDDEVRA